LSNILSTEEKSLQMAIYSTYLFGGRCGEEGCFYFPISS
jgi:hypothetical protein